MRLQRLVFVALSVALVMSASESYAHPGSGIVVDEQGNVYFTHIGRGVGRIDRQGKLTYVGNTHGGHWMCLDPEGMFSRSQPKYFERITPDGAKPALIYADGGSPVAVLRDGRLYYASNDDRMTPGGTQVTRQSPSGEISIFPVDGKKVTETLGITGLAPGPDGDLYIAQPNAVLKLKMDGTFITLASSIELQDCDVDYPDNNPQSQLPYLRGLAVDADGTVFAAGVGCHAVVKISPQGKVETVLKAERPWSPTGVAVHRGDAYILEYTNANGGPNEGWRPRIRRLDRNGSVVTLFTAEEHASADSAATRPLLVPAPGAPIPVTGGGGALIAGDINGDSCADLVLIAGKKLNVIFGGVNRVWSAKPDVEFELQSPASEIALDDINHDGHRDLVLAHHDSYGVAVLLGSGDGRFQSAEGSPFAAREGNQPHTHGLVVADFNEDGHLDIATANNSDGDISVLFGNGKGRFVRAEKSPFACGKSPYPIAAADVTGDGHVDLLIPNAAHGDKEVKTLTILLGDGKSGLTPAANSPLICDATLWYVATGDLNGDGRLDVIATHSEGGSGATILLNAGQGRLSPAPGSPLALGHGAWGAEIADMDRDGNADLVFAADEHIRIFLGDGRGGFKPAAGSPYPTGKGAWRLTVGDFNGDKKLDVASRCVEANQIAILYGN